MSHVEKDSIAVILILKLPFTVWNQITQLSLAQSVLLIIFFFKIKVMEFEACLILITHCLHFLLSAHNFVIETGKLPEYGMSPIADGRFGYWSVPLFHNDKKP